MSKKTTITNGERAMFTFFISTLVGPFLAAVLVVAASLIAGVVPVGAARSFVVADVGDLGLRAFVWAALPAGLAGAVLAAWVSLKGDLPWIVAVVTGVAAFGVTSVLVPGIAPALATPFAFAAALSALGVWHVLRRAGIVAG